MKNVHKLTEGAVLLAASTVLLLLTIYVPLAGAFINFVLPLPFIIFATKNSLKNIAAFSLAAVVLSFIFGSFIGLAIVLIYGFTGLVIGYFIQKNRSRAAIFISSTLTFMAILVILYAVSAAFFKLDIIHQLIEAFKESNKMAQDMLKSMGREEQLEKLIKQNTNLIKMVQTLAPSLLIMVSVLSVFIIQWICFPIAKRFGVNVQPWGSIRNLSFPRSLLWYYLIALGTNMLVQPEEGTFLYTVLINAIYILGFVMVFQGLAFLFHIFHQKTVAKGLRVLVVILAFTIPIIHYIIMILGIMDLGFDLRKRFNKNE